MHFKLVQGNHPKYTSRRQEKEKEKKEKKDKEKQNSCIFISIAWTY
jgi:hypothetical protein